MVYAELSSSAQNSWPGLKKTVTLVSCNKFIGQVNCRLYYSVRMQYGRRRYKRPLLASCTPLINYVRSIRLAVAGGWC